MNTPAVDRALDRVPDLVRATRLFVRTSVLPLEDAHDGDVTAAGGDALRVELQAAAREPASSVRTCRSSSAGRAWG